MKLIPQPVKLVDVARKAGVSTATVSLVINGNPRIPQSTADHVRKICDKLGYAPDPAARALSSHRTKNKENYYLGTIGWLTTRQLLNLREGHSRCSGRNWSFVRTLLEKLASVLGYRIDHFTLETSRSLQQTLNRTLWARGIKGLLIESAMEDVSNYHLDWDRFSIICLQGSLHSQNFHNITTSSYQDIFDGILRLQGRGYNRPGYFGTIIGHDHWHAGFLSACQFLGLQKKQQLMLNGPLDDVDNLKKFRRWLMTSKPDVIIANYDENIPEVISKAGRHIGYLCLDVPDTKINISGILQDRISSYRAAVDLLHSQIRRNETGVQQAPMCLNFRSHWNEGNTLNKSQKITRSSGKQIRSGGKSFAKNNAKQAKQK